MKLKFWQYVCCVLFALALVFAVVGDRLSGNQRVVGSGIYKVIVEGHEYYRTEHTMTHSENCSCQKLK